MRLITNGSLLHRRAVQEGIRILGKLGGEVWFKLDRGTPAEVAAINGVPMDADRIRSSLVPVSYTHLDVYKRQAWRR